MGISLTDAERLLSQAAYLLEHLYIETEDEEAVKLLEQENESIAILTENGALRVELKKEDTIYIMSDIDDNGLTYDANCSD
jgi:hypothetical protein